MKDLIRRAANMLTSGAAVEDIHHMLVQEGLSEYDAFLTYIAAKMTAADLIVLHEMGL